MARLGILIGPLVLLLCIFCVVDVLTTRGEPRHLPRWGWLVLVLLFPVVGSAAWLVVGRPGRAGRRARRYQRHSPAFPEYDRPGRIAARDTEADEEFLRQCRARAEEQRRRYREQQEQRRRQSEDPEGSAT
jgi:hypothetical protein